MWRRLNPDINLVFACIAADGLSWPAWRQARPDNAAAVARIVDTLRGWLPEKPPVILACHSGGGSFLFGFLNSAEQVPEWVERMIFLDANYSYDDEQRHGEKLLAWMKGDARRRLVVIAYDDRRSCSMARRSSAIRAGHFGRPAGCGAFSRSSSR